MPSVAVSVRGHANGQAGEPPGSQDLKAGLKLPWLALFLVSCSSVSYISPSLSSLTSVPLPPSRVCSKSDTAPIQHLQINIYKHH